MSASPDLTVSGIEEAGKRIAGKVRRTPCWHSAALSEELGRNIFVKLENLQIGGSFKIRGVLNRLMTMTRQERLAGIATVSGGNHAIAVAIAAKMLKLPAFVSMPRTAPTFNIEAARSQGAEVFLADDVGKAFEKAQSQTKQGKVFIHPFDDLDIIAGHGTVGLEIAESCQPTHVFISIGGGGFISGVGTALKARFPDIEIFGTEPEGAMSMTEAVSAGHPVTIKPTSTISTLAAPYATKRTLAHVQALTKEIVITTDSEAKKAVGHLMQIERLLCEPAAGCVLAAARRRLNVIPHDATICLVICGGNADFSALANK